MSVFKTLAEVLCDYSNHKEEEEHIYREKMLLREREKQHQKLLLKEKQHENWLKITEEELNNPDDFSILPYGWNPFGIKL